MEGPIEAIINSLDDAIISVDEQQRLIYLNAAAAALFGCAPEHVVNQPVRQCPALAAVWSRLPVGEPGAGAGLTRATRRLEMDVPDGDPVPLEALLARTVVQGQTCLTVVFRDLAPQQRMEAAVHQARKHQAVGALASGIAHDFNNILTAVISQLDLAIHSPDCPPAVRANLDYAQASARRGAELVAKLQLFSRQAQPKLVALNVAEIVEQVVFVLRHSIDPRIEINWQPPAAPGWPVLADISQLMQALINLGLNARDAMPQGGRLELTVANVTIAPGQARPPKQAGDFVRLTVADTGRGMSADTLARLFEPYFTTKDVSKGPGLGLSITFSVIAEHGGWMEAASQLGHGSQFHVYLPRTRQAPTAAPAADRSSVTAQALEGRERILVVDDEEAVRMVIRAVLSYRGYHVAEAGDGEEAVRQYADAPVPFDLVLMDLHMPRLSGRDALLRIRAQHPEAKAMLLSGGLQDPESEAVLEIEGVRFLQKPFDNEQLAAAVREALDHR